MSPTTSKFCRFTLENHSIFDFIVIMCVMYTGRCSLHDRHPEGKERRKISAKREPNPVLNSNLFLWHASNK